jgi:hypothetical protein
LNQEIPTNSSPYTFDPLFSGDNVADKTPVKEKEVIDSNSVINIEVKGIGSDSSFSTGHNVVPISSLKVCLTANPSIATYTLLQLTLQVFDQMRTKRLKFTSLNQQQTTKTTFVQVMARWLKDFNPKYIVCFLSSIQSQKATTTVESSTVERTTGPASG